MDDIRAKLLNILRESQKCTLCRNVKGPPVCFKGSLKPKYLFIGESPGESEITLHEPFVGPAGKLLQEMIKDAGLHKVAYTNVVWCLPIKKSDLSIKDAKKCTWWKKLLKLFPNSKIIAVGTYAKEVLDHFDIKYATWVYHPSHILRSEGIRKDQLWKINVARLKMIGFGKDQK